MLALANALMLGMQRPASYTFTNAEAEALVARFSVQPTNARKALIDDLVGDLKTAGVWSKMDALYVLAAHDSQAARQNWIADQYNLTAVSGPTFTADRGYTPDGAASYLDTAFNPTTATTPNLALNSAHMGAWHRTAIAASFDTGNTTSRIIYNPSTTSVRPNNATSATSATSYTTHKLWCRSAAAVWELYSAGVDVGGGTDASTALTSFNFGIGRTAAASFGASEASIFHFGSNLTAGEAADAYAAFNAYMQAVGAA